MMRFPAGGLAALILTLGTLPGLAAEIGYVADYKGPASSFRLLRDGAPMTVGLLTPIMDGDVIEVLAAGARLSLMLNGRSEPLIVTEANDGQPITGDAPERSWSGGLVGWASESIGILDAADREAVNANIREGSDPAINAPMMAVPQRLPAGPQSIAVGWRSPSVIRITILGPGDQVIEEARSRAPLWLFKERDYRPGIYRVVLETPEEKVEQVLEITAEAAPVPPDFADATVPPELAAATAAIFIAGDDPSRQMEALARVAPIARSSRAAKLVALAILRGKVPKAP